MVLARFPARVVELIMDGIMDGAYATKAWRGLPDRVTVTTRMRCNAAVFALAPPPTGKRGRPALKGARLASLAQLAATAVFAPVTICGPDGRSRIEHVWRTTCLWYGPFHTRPVTIMLIRKPDRSEGFDVAIASTDTTASSAELIARYDSRWTIETAHQDARRRRGPQPRPVSGPADRPVRVSGPDHHDRLVRAARQSRCRPRDTPRQRPVVPPEDHRQLQRHARRTTPRAHPPRISDASTRHGPARHKLHPPRHRQPAPPPETTKVEGGQRP
jgi:hypothetical protein